MHIQQNHLSLYSQLLSLIDILLYTIMITLVIFGISGYVCSQVFQSLKIQYWTLIFITSFIIVFVTLIYTTWNTYPLSAFSVRNFILGLLPYLVLLPGILVVILSIHKQIAIHTPFHMGYILQILNGTSPPENAVLPGYPANVYWLYHALLAIYVYILNITPPTASMILNLSALLGSIYWIRKSIPLLGLSKENAIIISLYSLFILFGANLFGSIYIISGIQVSSDVGVTDLLGLINNKNFILLGDPRLINLFRKFFLFTGVPIGIFYFSFGMYMSLRILRGELTSTNILLLAAALGALMYHTTTGIFMLLFIPASIFISLLFNSRKTLNSYIQGTKTFKIPVVLIILILSIPVLHYVYLAARALPAETSFGTAIRYNLISILSSAYPLILLSIPAILLTYREKTTIVLFFGIISTAGYTLSVIINLPDFNQYKFIFLSTISLCFICTIGLDYMYFNLKGILRWVGKLIFYTTFIILSVNLLLLGIKNIKAIRSGNKTYYYQNRNINLKKEKRYKESFIWLRSNSPSGTIVILPFPSKNMGRDHRINGNIYLIGERLPYVAFGDIYTEGMDEYYNRVEDLILFYSDETPLDKKVEILAKFEKFSRQRPSILLIPKEDLKSLAPHLEKLQLLYSGKDANLYSFNNN